MQDLELARPRAILCPVCVLSVCGLGEEVRGFMG